MPTLNQLFVEVNSRSNSPNAHLCGPTTHYRSPEAPRYQKIHWSPFQFFVPIHLERFKHGGGIASGFDENRKLVSFEIGEDCWRQYFSIPKIPTRDEEQDELEDKDFTRDVGDEINGVKLRAYFKYVPGQDGDRILVFRTNDIDPGEGYRRQPQLDYVMSV